MMKPGAVVKSQYQGNSNLKTIKNTYRKIRDEQRKAAHKSTHHYDRSSGGSGGRMYNYKQIGHSRMTIDDQQHYREEE